MDFRKAFSFVNQDYLDYKMKALGISLRVDTRLSSFLGVGCLDLEVSTHDIM